MSWQNFIAARCMWVPRVIYGFDGFTADRDLDKLVWYEHHHGMEDAIAREKLLKRWHRAWKFRIIEELNPNWRDLHDEIDAIVTLVEPKAQPRPSTG